MMPEKNLEKNIDYIERNRNKLFKEYANKFLLVHKQKITASYDQYNKAAEEGVRLYGTDGEFLVYHLTAKPPVNFVMEAAI